MINRTHIKYHSAAIISPCSLVNSSSNSSRSVHYSGWKGENLTFKMACSAPSFTAGYLRRASAERARRSASRAATKAIFVTWTSRDFNSDARVYDVITESWSIASRSEQQSSDRDELGTKEDEIENECKQNSQIRAVCMLSRASHVPQIASRNK